MRSTETARRHMAGIGRRSVEVTRVEPESLNPRRKGSVDECAVPVRVAETVRKKNDPWQVNELMGRDSDADSTGVVLMGARG